MPENPEPLLRDSVPISGSGPETSPTGGQIPLHPQLVMVMLSPFISLCLGFLIYKKGISNSKSLIEANNGSGITVDKKELLFAMPGSTPSILSLWAWGVPSTKQRPDYPSTAYPFPSREQLCNTEHSWRRLYLSSDALLSSPMGHCPSPL